MIKKILKILFYLIVLVILILLGLYIIPPGQESIEYDYAEIEKDANVSSKVGWYTAETGKNYQVTWAAKRGLQLNYFDENRDELKNLRVLPIRENEFDTNGDPETTEIRFTSSHNDSLVIMDVKTSKTELNAAKNDSLFYHQEEIEYFNGEVSLAGLLLKPVKDIKSTAIVIIHGSGVSDRDSFWYMYQADYLARKGYTVLLPDKRGCGKSQGEWHTASFDDFADDIVAALKHLESTQADEFSKVGVMGISQGGWISHLVNEKYPGLDFILDVVGASTTPNEQLRFEVKNEIQGSGAPGFLANPLSLVFAKRARGKRKIWWDKNGEFDPIPLIANSDTPVLKVFTDEDENVPVESSINRINALLQENRDLPVEIKLFEGSGHALMDKDTRWIRTDYLEYVSTWISKN